MTDEPLLLRKEEGGDNEDVFPERRYVTPTEHEHINEPYFDSHTLWRRDSEAPFDFQELCQAGTANAQDSYLERDSERSFAHQPGRTNAPLQSAEHSDETFVRGVERYTELSTFPARALTTVEEAQVLSPHCNIHNNSTIASRRSPYSMATALQFSARNAAQAPPRASRYQPFRNKFHDPRSASTFRKTATRFDRKPYRLPETDPSITEIARDRARHVERIYNAMTRADAARDNHASIAMKRWVHGAYYHSDLVEAYAHKVLDCLLAQATEGFRGWLHNDYVADDRKGEDEDRDVDCAARLDNIIRALEEEKTICEDVMNSACQIRMFVNAPKAYANRKYQNRVGNSKRARPKDSGSDAGIRVSKMRKTNSRQTNRTRQASLSAVQATRDDLYVSQTPETPHKPPPHSRHAGNPHSNGLTFFTPSLGQPGSSVRPSFAHHQAQVMSPSSSHTSRMTRIGSVPIRDDHTLFSPPPLSVSHPSAPVTPEEPKPPTGSFDAWPNMHLRNHITSSSQFSGAGSVDDSLFGQFCEWPAGSQTFTPMSANLFDQHPDAAMLGFSQLDGSSMNQSLHSLWQNQKGAHQLSYERFPSNGSGHQP